MIYLVCTRSAICASALTYIINQSPKCYNLVHNNLYFTEKGKAFNDAVTINDWWNIPDTYSSVYNIDIRNNERMDPESLKKLLAGWAKLDTGKSIALFTHATNTAELIEYKNTHKLPITIITTIMGANSYLYLDLFLKREYSDEMNPFTTIDDTWKYLYNQYINQDTKWAEHADIVLEMDEWLGDPTNTYNKLKIFHNNNIKPWVQEYLQRNSYNEWDIGVNDTTNKLKAVSYLFQHNQHKLPTIQSKKLLALASLESVRHHASTVDEVIERASNILRYQLTTS
jgi:hypothetical protein